MPPLRPIAWALLLTGLLAPAAAADVIVLKGNDVPLTGRILKDEAGYIRFQIKGLGHGSFVDVQKSRIARYWKEENTYWEYQEAEARRRTTIERLETAPGRSDPPEEAADALGANPAGAGRGRSEVEIRQDFLHRALARARRSIPDSPALRILLFLGLYGGVTLLLFVGSRVADLPKFRIGKAALLSLITAFFVVLAFLAGRHMLRPESFPFVVTGELLAWVLFSRILGGGPVSKSVLLLSFFLASIFLLGATAFGVLAAI